jgi:hypothetical protein
LVAASYVHPPVVETRGTVVVVVVVAVVGVATGAGTEVLGADIIVVAVVTTG